MVVGVSDAPIVLFLIFVFFRIRSRIAPQPELLHKLLFLFVRLKPFECCLLFIGNDVKDVLVQPLLPGALQLLPELLFFCLLLLFGKRLGDGSGAHGCIRAAGLLATLIARTGRLLVKSGKRCQQQA